MRERKREWERVRVSLMLFANVHGRESECNFYMMQQALFLSPEDLRRLCCLTSAATNPSQLKGETNPKPKASHGDYAAWGLEFWVYGWVLLGHD